MLGAASSMTSSKPTLRLWLEKLWNESQLCMPWRMKYVAAHLTNDAKFGKHRHAPCSSRSMTGSKPH